jgi:hypothetical protein
MTVKHRPIDLEAIRELLAARRLEGNLWAVTASCILWDGEQYVRAASDSEAVEKVTLAVADAQAKGVPAWQLPSESP